MINFSASTPKSERILLGASADEPELGSRALLRTYSLQIPEKILASCQQELITSKASGVAKFTARAENFKELYPRTLEVANILAEELLEPLEADLSFIRASKPQPTIYADNIHYDARYVGYSERRGIRQTFWRPSKSVELWRQLINLADAPRHLQIIDAPLEKLESEGIDIYALRPAGEDIHGYDNPESIPAERLVIQALAARSRVYTIPGYDGENLPVLEFWSSRLLHAGVTGRDGQLTAAAGRWMKPGGES